MGPSYQLREALRCLCVEIGWSYAVFWRSIGCKSPMHLIWEDGHVSESRAEVLVNKIMTQQVHLVGEGIVGQAAARGSHQWILTDNIQLDGLGTKDSAELNHQSLVGIQTIAVIPVLPHGVLQLGSTQIVMENILFVNHVKDLLVQLECSTGVHSPDMTLKALDQSSQLSAGISLMASEKLPATASVPLPCVFYPITHPVSQHNLHPNSQCEGGRAGVQGMLWNPNVRSIQLSSSHDLTSTYQDHQSLSTSDPSSSSLPLLEHHLATCSMKSWESAKRIGTCDSANALRNVRSLPVGSRETNRIAYANISSTDAVQILPQSSQSGNCHGIPADPFLERLSIKMSEPTTSAGSQKQENGLFNACDLPSTESNVKGLCDRALLRTLQECGLSNCNDSQGNQSYKNDTGEANDADISHVELNIKNEDKPKFSCVFPVQSTSGNDLYDILGPDFKMDSFSVNFNDILVNKDNASANELAEDNSTCMVPLDACPITHPLGNGVPGSELFSTVDANQLLDAVVSKINSGRNENSDDAVSCRTTVTDTCSPSVPVVSPRYKLTVSSEQMQNNSSSLPSLPGNAEGLGSVSAKPVCTLDTKNEDISQSAGVFKSQISLWVESGQSMHSDSLSGAHDEKGKSNRKRARPGENPRPRPKDRQMIMDRVKELREIVPNGAKCSIDALLEKTIKHMLFLQSVTKHADNLKNIGEPKFIDKEGGILLKDDFAGGATWAFQVGSQSMTCPIIVEDLNPPRQMLVEMLCEQRGFFLEIADLIRGLGLTILKGAMEAHEDKIWARFAVEANRDVTRMEVFLSLVHVLESTVGCSTVPQGVDNMNMPHNNAYHQSCIAATGTSNRLL